ncbi:MAG: phage tail sheath family protein [Anaerolineales bacterium]|nr:phage tail sheath family protein [Anaerolineales bacterium]
MPTYQTPGIYREDRFPAPAAELQTGVPAFLGYADKESLNTAQRLTHWSQFEQQDPPLHDGYLAEAVRGFFENGGQVCYVIRLDDDLPPEAALGQGLAALEPLNTIDLICAPDIMRSPAEAERLQRMVLQHCDSLGDRFAILDSGPSINSEIDLKQRQGLKGTNGALYFPWVGVRPEGGKVTYVPPCGHVAGVYARSDQQVGVHKAPANQALVGVVSLQVELDTVQQGPLNDEHINCLRAFPGRGIRVWGARTLSRDPAWTYINVRRVFLTAGRWIERNLTGVVYEPNTPLLWNRIQRELTTYFSKLFRQGALKGRATEEAFYIKCDAETNPPEVREAGQVITEIGLAPAVPGEFIVVRIIHSSSGMTMAG